MELMGKLFWQSFRMYNVNGKLLSGTTSMHVDSLVYDRVKGVRRSGLRYKMGEYRGCIMST